MKDCFRPINVKGRIFAKYDIFKGTSEKKSISTSLDFNKKKNLGSVSNVNVKKLARFTMAKYHSTTNPASITKLKKHPFKKTSSLKNTNIVLEMP